MFQKLNASLQRFMYGRNGVDQFNIALLILGMALCLIGSFSSWYAVYFLAYVPLLYAIFRMFSRNIPARRRENARVVGLWNRIRDRSHCYFHCPNCGQTVRVPKGKGKISIRCPKCGESFVKKT